MNPALYQLSYAAGFQAPHYSRIGYDLANHHGSPARMIGGGGSVRSGPWQYSLGKCIADVAHNPFGVTSAKLGNPVPAMRQPVPQF